MKTIYIYYSGLQTLVVCTLLLAGCLLVANPVEAKGSLALSYRPHATQQQLTTEDRATPSSTESQIAQAVFRAINRARAAAKLPLLQWSGALATSARQHDFAMAIDNKLSHQLPGEPFFSGRESRQGVHWVCAGENIGVTTARSIGGALHLHKMMMAERPPNDGHRENILDASFTIVGIDILFDSKHHKLWLTEDFARV